jgi:hypothetical protein
MAGKTEESRRVERAEELVSDLWTPVWTCPSCGRPFAQLHQSHSCGGESVRRYLEGKPPKAIALYRRFAALVRGCGPVAIVPGPAGIAFHAHGTFAAIDRLTARALSAHVVLRRRHPDTRFAKVDVRSPDHQIHHFRAKTPADLDEDVAAWLAEAYEASEHT